MTSNLNPNENYQPLVSIVVPIYNVEAFLKPALASIQAQIYDNLEVLLIDDGATDSSPIIAQEFASQNDNWTVYTKPNGGLADARNYGLERAHGEYIYFMDSDDTIERTLIEKAVKYLVDKNLDTVVFDYQQIDEKGKAIESFYGHGSIYQTMNPLAGRDLLKCIFKQEVIITAWSYVAKRGLFLNHDIRFTQHRLHEDVNTTPLVIFYSNQVGLLPDKMYNYRVRQGSIMKQLKPQNLVDSLWMLQQLQLFMEHEHVVDIYKHEFDFFVYQSLEPYILNISDSFFRKNPDIRNKYFELLTSAVKKLDTVAVNTKTRKKLKLAQYYGMATLFHLITRRPYIF